MIAISIISFLLKYTLKILHGKNGFVKRFKICWIQIGKIILLNQSTIKIII